MLTRSQLLLGLILPVVLAAAAMLLALRPWRRGKRSSAGVLPIVAGFCFALAFGSLQGFKHVFPPDGAILWIFYAAFCFAFLGWIDAFSHFPAFFRAILVLLCVFIASAVMLRFEFVNHNWDRTTGLLWLTTISLAATLWWGSFEQARTAGIKGTVLAMAGVVGISGLVIAVLVDLTIGQSLAVLAVVLLLAQAIVAWGGNASTTRGLCATVAGIAVLSIAAALTISSLPGHYALMLAASPVVLWVARVPGIAKKGGWLRSVIVLSLLLIALAIVVVLAICQAQQDNSQSDPYAQLMTPSADNVASRFTFSTSRRLLASQE